MLIRHQGNLIKVLRVEPPTHLPTRGCRREHVLSTFRADEPILPELLDALSRDERKSLERWLAFYQEGLARPDARQVVATAPAQLESLVSALEVAADTLSAADADHLWTQLQAIARTLKRAGRRRRCPGSKISSANTTSSSSWANSKHAALQDNHHALALYIADVVHKETPFWPGIPC